MSNCLAEYVVALLRWTTYENKLPKYSSIKKFGF